MAKKTQEQIRYNMQRVKSKDTQIEVILRKELWHRGLRYRKNAKTILGKPDIAFIGAKVAVFCDSEFWHGFNWDVKQHEIKSNRDFWIAKIQRNIERDRTVTRGLEEAGWTVLRFWGREIQKNALACADIVESNVRERTLCRGSNLRLSTCVQESEESDAVSN